MVPLWGPIAPRPSSWRHPGHPPRTAGGWGAGVQGLTACLAAGLVCVMGLWRPRSRRHALEQENRKAAGLVGSGRDAQHPCPPQGSQPQAPQSCQAIFSIQPG